MDAKEVKKRCYTIHEDLTANFRFARAFLESLNDESWALYE